MVGIGIERKGYHAVQGALLLITDFFALITALLMFVTCYSLWSNLEGSDVRLRLLLLGVVFAASLLLWLVYPLDKDEVGKGFLWILIVCASYGLVGCVTGDFGNKSTLLYFAFAAIAPIYIMLMSRAGKLGMLLRSYINVAAAFAAASLVLWVLGPVGHVLSPNCSIENTWTGVKGLSLNTPGYFGLLYTPQTITNPLTGSVVARNTGIFTEAPMYAFVLCCALFMELFFRPEVRKWVVVLLVVTICTSFSATGVVLCAGGVFGKWFAGALHNDRGKALRMLAAFLVFLAVALGVAMVLEQKSSTASGLTRLDDFYAGFQAWMQSPLFGNGLANTAAAERFMSAWRMNNVGFSNSLFNVLSRGGLVLLLVYAVGFAGFFLKSNMKFRIFGILFFVMWIFTIINFAPVAGMVLSIGTARCIGSTRLQVGVETPVAPRIDSGEDGRMRGGRTLFW